MQLIIDENKIEYEVREREKRNCKINPGRVYAYLSTSLNIVGDAEYFMH